MLRLSIVAASTWFATAHSSSKTCANREGSTASIKTAHGRTTISCANKHTVTITNSVQGHIPCAAVKSLCAAGATGDLIDINFKNKGRTHISTRVSFDNHRLNGQKNSIELECSDPKNGRVMIMQFHGEGMGKAPNAKELQPLCYQFLTSFQALTADSHSPEPMMFSDEEMSAQPLSVAEPATTTEFPDESFATLFPDNSKSHSKSLSSKQSHSCLRSSKCHNCRHSEIVVKVRAL